MKQSLQNFKNSPDFEGFIGTAVVVLFLAAFAAFPSSSPQDATRFSVVSYGALQSYVASIIDSISIAEDTVGCAESIAKAINYKARRNPSDAINSSFYKELLPMSRAELLSEMEREGFRLPKGGLSETTLRRIYAAYHYEWLYYAMNKETGLPQSVIFAYHVIESIDSKTGETKKHRKGFNFGGIKARKGQKFAKAMDDCHDKNGKPIPCNFAIYQTAWSGMKAWAQVFNQDRYGDCKSQKTVQDVCKCLYEGGYHTSKNWRSRATLAEKYWGYRKYFPMPK